MSCYISVSDIQVILHCNELANVELIPVLSFFQKDIIKKVSTEDDVETSEAMEEFFVKLQAQARGYLFRKRMNDKYDYFYDNVDKITNLQKIWRKKLSDRHNHSVTDRNVTQASALPKAEIFLEYFRQHVNTTFVYFQLYLKCMIIIIFSHRRRKLSRFRLPGEATSLGVIIACFCVWIDHLSQSSGTSRPFCI